MHVLDHCDKEALMKKYRRHEIAVENIEEVDCDSLLKKAGVLSLAVPDKRYSFDHFRPITGIGAGTRLELLQQVDREHALS